MVKKGRGFNIAAGVLDIILSVGFLALSGLFMFASFFISIFGAVEDAFGGPGVLDLFAAFGIIFAVGALILFVVILVLGILILKTANATPKDYYQKTGRMLGIAIVMTILVAFSSYALVEALTVETIVLYVALLAIVAFHWAGYGMAKHASKKYANEIENSSVEVSPEVKVKEKKEEIQTNDPKIEKLEKLSKLKEAGIISQDDFEKMKEKIINE